MLNKALVITIALGVILSVFCKVLYDKVQDLKKVNQTLQRALESNLEAAKKKEERNEKELQKLQQELTELSKIDDACLDATVTDDLIKFLQQLQQDSNGTLSITFTKQSGVSDRN